MLLSGWQIVRKFRAPSRAEPVMPCHCDQCGKEYASQYSLKAHVMKVHEKSMDNSNWQCPDCGNLFHSKAGLKKHQSLHRNQSYISIFYFTKIIAIKCN